jgi:hypothetical protein
MSADDPGDEALGQSDQERISNAIYAFTERRALIEQTKGMLMFVYGIDATGAFELLRWQSQQNNVKLRLLAEQISKDLVELSRANGPARRLAIDGLMLTAHQRIAQVAARQTDGQSKTRE